MSEVYSQTFHVRWSDLDPNQHMRHSAYLDLCAATRFSYLESLGFDRHEFAKSKMGPILFSEHIQYRTEVLAGEKVRVNIHISAMSEDGRKWQMRHEMFRESDGKLAAILDISGAWFSLVERKIQPPPEKLKSVIENFPKTEDFKIL